MASHITLVHVFQGMISGTPSGYDFWYHFREWLSVPLLGMTSGNDFRYLFRVWIPVPLLDMTSGNPSGYDFRCHFWSLLVWLMASATTSGHVFQYHIWSWLPVPLPVMASGTTSGHDFRYYSNIKTESSWFLFLSLCSILLLLLWPFKAELRHPPTMIPLMITKMPTQTALSVVDF